MIGGLVLAAGGGSRFGGPKQLADIAGRPMLEHPLEAMAAARLDRVCVVLGAEADAIVRAVDLRGAEVVRCARWAEGQAASLRAGVGALSDCEAVVVVLGDQPFISPDAVDRVIGARRPGADAVRATYGGVPAHPVLLERTLYGRVARLQGDEGARGVLGRASVVDTACDGLGRPDDIDTRDHLDRARRDVGGGPRPAREEAVST